MTTTMPAARCMRMLTAITAAAFAFAGIGAAAHAQTAPARPITLVVPYAAGGPTDAIARVIGDHMSRTLGQPFVIENVAGAAGTAGAERVAKAAPDGHTLLIHHLALVAAPNLFTALRYDTRTAFAPVGLVNTGPLILVGRNSLEAKTARELFDWIRKTGDRVTIGHSGPGSNSHLCALMLDTHTSVRMTQVAYRGAAPTMNDLVGGQIDLSCDQSTNSVPQVLAGTVRAFAVTSAMRNDAVPNVPTTAEAGAPSIAFAVWHGVYAPAGTPPDMIAKLNAALGQAIADPAIVAKFAQVGTVVYPSAERTPEAHAKLFHAEIDRIAALLKSGAVPKTDAK